MVDIDARKKRIASFLTNNPGFAQAFPKQYERTKMLLRDSKQPKKDYRGSTGPSWLKDILAQAVRNRQVICSLTPTVEIITSGSSALYHGYPTLNALVAAAASASQGAATKQVITGALSVAIASVNSAATNNIPGFGWRLRIAASQTNFAFRAMRIDVGPIVNTAGVFTCPNPVLTAFIAPRRLPVDLIVLSPANAGSFMTIVPSAQGDLAAGATSAQPGLLVGIVDANHFASIESLNGRDLISRPVNQGPPLRDESLMDAVYDGEEDDPAGERVFSGIR
jgi:hypothetical protein